MPVLALAALALHLASPLAEAQDHVHAAAGAQAAQAPSGSEAITERDILFAYHRMRGTEPDFAILAELEIEAAPSSPYPVRDPAADRRYRLILAERRLRRDFAAFDLDQIFTVEIGAEILGHDRELGGIPLEAAGLGGVFLRDPTGQGPGFRLRFRNPEAVSVIPIAQAAAAAALLQGARLASYGDWAGHGTIRLSFVFAGVPPRATEVGQPPVAAEIVGAEVESWSGALLHRFAGIGSRAAAAAARNAGPPPLRVAELAGIRIGMDLAEAHAVALRTFPEPLGAAYYDALPEAARLGRRHPRCSDGLVADLRVFDLPLSDADSFASCLAPVPRAAEDESGGVAVAEVVELRFVPGALAEEVRTELHERFGPPLEELAEGPLIWIGPAPDGAEPLLELRADFVRVAEGGPRREAGVLLALSLREYRQPTEDGP